MVDNVFVLGLDEANRRLLRRLPHALRYRFHPLLGADTLLSGAEVPLEELLALAQARLESFPGSIDAITGYWDFPVTSMVPILCSRFRLPGAALDAVVKCEHKYWSRLVQQEVTDACPPFALVDLAGPPRPPGRLRYPMWVKPVAASSSMWAYHVDGPEDFAAAVGRIQRGADRVAKAFDYLLPYVAAPSNVEALGGRACLAEEALHGWQATVEGYSFQGRVHVYGLVDTIRYPGSPSFLRYQYPSRLPEPVARRMADITTRVVERIGLDSCAFNIEFFWDPDRDRVGLLEINPRVSQSHALLFDRVGGIPNHQCMVRLALGRDPDLQPRHGRNAIAAKWFLRRFRDGVVCRRPSIDDIARAEQAAPGAVIRLTVNTGSRLSHLLRRDSYSYCLAEIDLAARDEQELTAKYQRCTQLLPFEFDDE